MAKAREIEGLTASTTFREAAAETVAVRAGELFEHAAGVLDTSDIERVHDMRVATRRLRAVLEIYAPCFPKGELKGVLKDVKAFAAAVTADDRPGLEVYAELLRSEQDEGNARLAAALDEAERRDLRGRLARLVEAAR
jgi:CHAD domain-containing protein